MIANLFIKLVEYYQRTGGGQRWFKVDCCFEPTCSEYCRQAILTYGLLKGMSLGFERILRCKDRQLAMRIQDPLSR